MGKRPLTIQHQIQQLKDRGRLFGKDANAPHFLATISYYRLQGYWWDMQSDAVNHIFKPNTRFEAVIERYNFDRHLRLILFDAIERVEIALRTKMIYHLSLAHGAFWYLNPDLFDDKAKYNNTIKKITQEFDRSQEIFAKKHRNKHKNDDPESWKMLEVVSIGSLSKLYKNLNHQLPEKTTIANEMGLHFQSELSSWLEAVVYIRNILAHHSRLWGRNMAKRPKDKIRNPLYDWFDAPLQGVQTKKVFLIISTLLYLSNNISPGHSIKDKIKDLINKNPNVPIYKLGFLNDWDKSPLWK